MVEKAVVDCRYLVVAAAAAAVVFLSYLDLLKLPQLRSRDLGILVRKEVISDSRSFVGCHRRRRYVREPKICCRCDRVEVHLQQKGLTGNSFTKA